MPDLLKARVTISRCIPSSGAGTIRIRIEDDASLRRIVECDMSFADFAAAVTGQGHLPASMDYVPDPDNLIGKYRETQTLGIPKPPSYDPKARAAYVRANKDVRAAIKEGWQLSDDGVGRRQDGDMWTVILVRYVAEKPA